MDMNLFFIFLLTFLVGFLTMKLAERRGRNGPVWFCLGVLGGIFAVIALLLLKPIKEERSEEEKSLFFFDEEEEEGEEKEKDALDEEKVNWDPALYDWYYLNEKKQQEGPFTFRDLLTLWKEKKISLNTYVWYEELEEWKHLQDITHLRSALNKE